MTLDGHQGRPVAIDLCTGCQALWFDKYESLQLAPGSTLRLMKLIGESASRVPTQFSVSMRCPRCVQTLRQTQDMQRNTRFTYFRCLGGHGRFIRFFEFLREKNFISPLSEQQIGELRLHIQIVNCSSCGGPIDLAAGSLCPHCKSPVSVLDMKRPQELQCFHAIGGNVQVDMHLRLFKRFPREPDIACTIFYQENFKSRCVRSYRFHHFRCTSGRAK